MRSVGRTSEAQPWAALDFLPSWYRVDLVIKSKVAIGTWTQLYRSGTTTIYVFLSATLIVPRMHISRSRLFRAAAQAAAKLNLEQYTAGCESEARMSSLPTIGNCGRNHTYPQP